MGFFKPWSGWIKESWMLNMVSDRLARFQNPDNLIRKGTERKS